MKQKATRTELERDAARWRWLRKHACISVSEDGDLGIGLHLADEDWEQIETYLTARQRRNLNGSIPYDAKRPRETLGIECNPATLDAAADFHRDKAVTKSGDTP